MRFGAAVYGSLLVVSVVGVAFEAGQDAQVMTNWAGAWSRETGAELALAAAVLQIAGWALVAGRRAGWTWLRSGLFAAVDGALGIVLLEKLVH